MTPGQIIALIRDGAILVGVGLILWFVWHSAHNAEELKSMKADLKQIQANEATAARWRQEQTDASEHTANGVKALNDRLNNAKPVIVRVPVPAGAAAPGNPGTSGSRGANAPGAPPGPAGSVREVDVTAVLGPLERKYGTALIECQGVLDAWPR